MLFYLYCIMNNDIYVGVLIQLRNEIRTVLRKYTYKYDLVNNWKWMMMSSLTIFSISIQGFLLHIYECIVAAIL